MIATAGAGFVVGIDLGTSNTVAVIRSPDGRRRAVLFDGAPLMPSAVFLQPDGRLVVGRDAQRFAQLEPARFEPNPKRRIDEGTVLLADQEVPTVELLAAVFRAVGAAVGEVCPSLPPVVLTFPASWGQHRRQLLYDAASAGGWPQISLVPEPIAAAHYFISVFRQPVPSGATMAVFDFGGGTVDIAVVRYDGHAFAVLGSGGLQDLGGLDIDAALVEDLGEILTQTAPDVWARLQRPVTAQDRRDRRLFWEDVRGAKEMLSRGTVAPVPIPGVEAALHITREELERLVGPLLHQAATETAAVVKRCGIEPRQLTWVLLVGGSSRVPLIARMLHTELGVAPTVLEQPELPVAEGALVDTAELGIDGLGAADPTGDGEARRGYFTDDAAFAGPTSLGPAYSGAPWYQVGDVVMGDRPVSGSPVSGAPVSASPVSGSPGWPAATAGPAASTSTAPAPGSPAPAPPSLPIAQTSPPTAPTVGRFTGSARVPTQSMAQRDRVEPVGSLANAVQTAPAPESPATSRQKPTRDDALSPSDRGSRRRAVIISVAAAMAVALAVGIGWMLIANRSNNGGGGNSGAAQLVGNWKHLANLPVELEGAAAAGHQNKLWVAGGLSNDTGRPKLTTTWIYDPQTDKWESGPSLPTPTSHAVLVGTPGGLYFIGGWVQDGGSRQVLRFNDEARRWDEASPLPDARVAGAAVWDGTRIIFAGGTRRDESPADEIWALDRTGWVEIGKLRRGRQKLTGVSDQAGQVWFLAGRDQQTGNVFGDIDRLSQGKVDQTVTAAVDPPREAASAVMIEGVGLCLLGGQFNDQYFDWWCDRPGAVDRLPKLELPRAGMGVGAIGKTVYAVGGYNASRAINGTNRLDAFTPTP